VQEEREVQYPKIRIAVGDESGCVEVIFGKLKPDNGLVIKNAVTGINSFWGKHYWQLKKGIRELTVAQSK
jgi:hypothetical protein